jgi:hypothetical protein
VLLHCPSSSSPFPSCLLSLLPSPPVLSTAFGEHETVCLSCQTVHSNVDFPMFSVPSPLLAVSLQSLCPFRTSPPNCVSLRQAPCSLSLCPAQPANSKVAREQG